MPKLRNLFNISNLKTIDDLIKYLSPVLSEISDTINGKLDFDSNIRTSFVTCVFTAANVETAITHTVGRVPMGYILAGSSAVTRLYDGTTANTDSIIYLKSDAAVTARILIF